MPKIDSLLIPNASRTQSRLVDGFYNQLSHENDSAALLAVELLSSEIKMEQGKHLKEKK